jgi:hypothetical protein
MSNLSDNSSTEFCYSFDDTPLGAEVLHIAVLSVIVLLSLLANGLVLLLVARYKQLRRRSTMVSLSVVVVDILLTVTFTVPVLVTAAIEDWVFMDEGCVFFGTFSFQFLMTRWLIMAILCVDRFSTVRFPFSYKKYSKKILFVLIFLAWLIPLFFSLPVPNSNSPQILFSKKINGTKIQLACQIIIQTSAVSIISYKPLSDLNFGSTGL